MINENNINEYKLTKEELLEKIGEDYTIRDFAFPSKGDALEYFEDMEKVYDSIAVKYLKPLSNFEDSEEYKELNNKLEESIMNYLSFPESLLKKLSEQKSNQKGCGNCKSSINKDYHIKNKNEELLKIIEDSKDIEDIEDIFNNKMIVTKCPICGSEDFILTETETSKLKSLKNKIQTDKKKIKEEEISFSIKNGNEEVWITFSK